MLGRRARRPTAAARERPARCSTRRARTRDAGAAPREPWHGRHRPICSPALEAYLDHLRVERGLAAATDPRLRHGPARASRATRRDIERVGDRARACRAATWRRSSRPPRPLRPASHRRKAAAIRAFYRFCFARGAHRARRREPARPAARRAASCRTPSTWTTSRRCSTRPDATDPRASATGRCWSCCTPPGLRVSEALGPRPGTTCRSTDGVRAGHRQGRPGAAGAGGRRGARGAGRYLDEVRPARWLARRRIGTGDRRRGGGPLFVSAARSSGWVAWTAWRDDPARGARARADAAM